MAALLQRAHDHLRFFSLAGALVLGFGACFIEPAPPASLRFDCSSDSDCDPTQRCTSGLCQQPCGSDGDEPCSMTSLCLNGYCSGTCLIADAQCSSPQVCQSLALPGEEPSDTGFCMIPCSDEAPCGEGQLCYEDLGVCLTSCMATEDCGEGEECLAGFCVTSF
jgi:hypothetical protein